MMSKKLLLCIVGMLFAAGQSWGQEHSSAHLYAQIFSDEGLLVSSLSLDKMAAENFDFKKYILDNKEVSRLKVSNILRSEMTVDKHLFDSKEVEDMMAEQVCITTSVSATPALGVVVKGRDDLTGVDVTKVIAGGPAAQLGIPVGAVLYTFNDEPIDSYCDLKMAVARTEIGAEAPLHYESLGQSINQEIIVGAKSINTHTYTLCDEEIELESPIVTEVNGQLATYPNPTRKSSFINYKSELTSPVSLSILDMNGMMIHSEKHDYFSGELRLEYLFDQAALAGVYLFVIEQDDKKYYSRVLLVRN